MPEVTAVTSVKEGAEPGPTRRLDTAGLSVGSVTVADVKVTLPEWLLEIDDRDLARSFDDGALARGQAYARNGRVKLLNSGASAGELKAVVRGSRGRTYITTVWAPEEDPEGRYLGSDCTCPMGEDCKHGVAVIAHARSLAPAASASPQAPLQSPWEHALGSLLAGASPSTPEAARPLGLRLERLAAPRYNPYTSHTDRAPGSRLRLVPVTEGRNGSWVKSGASWRDLQSPYTTFVPSQRLALCELASLSKIGAGYGYYHDQDVYLDELSASLWPLLRRLEEAAVPLLYGDRDATPVRVAPEPLRVILDVSSDSTGCLAAAPTLIGDGVQAVLGADRLLGKPVHGVVRETDNGLLLAPLDIPPAPPLAKLMADGERLVIPAADVGRFLREWFPGLARTMPVDSLDGSVSLPEVAPPRLALTATYDDRLGVTTAWTFEYAVGDEVVSHPVDEQAAPGQRDRTAERRLVQDLDPSCDSLSGLFLTEAGLRRLGPVRRISGIDAVGFVDETLPMLRDSGALVVREVGERPDFRLVDDTPEVQIRTEKTGEGDWFDLFVTATVEGEEVPFEALFSALALGEPFLFLGGGRYIPTDRPEFARLRSLIEEARGLADQPGEGLRVSPFHAGFWKELCELGVVDEQGRKWAEVVDKLAGITEIPTPEPPVTLKALLRPYQLAGYHWLAFLVDHGLGGILADDMGLGKTVQALALLCREREADRLDRPTLVVAPASVVHNWAAEADRFAPDLDVVTVTETSARRGTPLAELVAGADVVLTSYALFRLDFDEIDALSWSGLLLDEAQMVKNHASKTYQCVRRLEAPYKIAITGTPLENNLMDLWSQLSIVAPGLFPHPQKFSEVYRKPIEQGADPELLPRLRRRIRPLMLRRTKEQVAPELPAKLEQVVEVQLEPRHRKIYDTQLQRERQKILGLIDDLNRNRFTILKSLTLLRQLSLDPALVDPQHANVRSAKVEALIDQLVEVTSEGHRALVFSQFTGFLRRVRERLDAAGIDYAYLDGRTRKRADAIDSFKSGRAPVFLISLKAGGFGLNLTEADYVFVLDPWWNPATEAQAVDRTHRIGQDKPVMVYRLVSADTIEQKVMALKERKSKLFREVMSDGDALGGAPLTGDDIRGLLE